jgi:hypothetical protein
MDKDKDCPTNIQALFEILWKPTVIDNMGKMALMAQLMEIVTNAMLIAMPYLFKGCQTITRNLSMAIKNVDIVDTCIDNMRKKLSV